GQRARNGRARAGGGRAAPRRAGGGDQTRLLRGKDVPAGRGGARDPGGHGEVPPAPRAPAHRRRPRGKRSRAVDVISREEFEDLLGAFALDACDADEMAAVEQYVAAHPEVNREVERLRAAAAGLAAS